MKSMQSQKSMRRPSEPQQRVDPRTGLGSVDIPPSLVNFFCLRDTVLHWLSPCALLAGGNHIPSSVVDETTRRHLHTSEELILNHHVLVVNDTSVYVMDYAAVVIRCLPIACIGRLITYAEVAVAHDRSGLADAVRRSDPSADRANPYAALTKRAVREGVCVSVVGFEVDAAAHAAEHDMIIALPIPMLRDLCALLIRIHYAHFGPDVLLAVDAVASSPHNDGVPHMGDIFGGARTSNKYTPNDAQLMPLDSLQTQVRQRWTLRVEPFRTWQQLAELLEKKRAVLERDAKVVDAEFLRIRGLLAEAASADEEAQRRALAAQNEALCRELDQSQRLVQHLRQLVERHVPNGASLLQELGLFRSGVASSLSPDPLLFQRTSNKAVDSLRFGDTFSPSVAQLMMAPPQRSEEQETAVANGVPRCARCRQLEYLLESHPNVDKLRIAKAEETLLETQLALETTEGLLGPLRVENEKLAETLRSIADRLVLLGVDVQDSGGREKISSHCDTRVTVAVAPLRDALRLVGPFYYDNRSGASNAPASPAVDRRASRKSLTRGLSTISVSSPTKVASGSTTKSSQAKQPDSDMTLSDELRAWRLLVNEQARRHEVELSDLKQAFLEYDEVMFNTVSDALLAYVPRTGVSAADAAASIFNVAKRRASDATTATAKATRGYEDNAFQQNRIQDATSLGVSNATVSASNHWRSFDNILTHPPETPMSYNRSYNNTARVEGTRSAAFSEEHVGYQTPYSLQATSSQDHSPFFQKNLRWAATE